MKLQTIKCATEEAVREHVRQRVQSTSLTTTAIELSDSKAGIGNLVKGLQSPSRKTLDSLKLEKMTVYVPKVVK